MDRLSTVAVTAALAALSALVGAACKDDAAAPVRRERVNAVKATAHAQPGADDMCDQLYAPGEGPVFAWPELAQELPRADRADQADVAAMGQWRWINVWATWCKPCITELPRILEWQAALAEGGLRVRLELLSADLSAEDVAAFRASHPDTPPSARLPDIDALAVWAQPMGIAGTTLPIHIFVDPSGRVRCVRASAVEDADYPAVERLLRGPG